MKSEKSKKKSDGIIIIPEGTPFEEYSKERSCPEKYTEWIYDSNPKRCQKTDRADYYREGGNGQLWKEYGYSCSSINVLEFLWGQPWNNLALNYVRSLRPSIVRVVKDGCCCDAKTWRVTVWLKDDDVTIKSIEQEVEVGVHGSTNGHELDTQLRKQKSGEGESEHQINSKKI